jgi:DNA-binding NarL/FixJ family response regulator
METPGARFIVLTTYDGDEDIYRALQAGASAYLLKGMTSEELISDDSRAVHAGKSHIPPAIAEKLAERMGTKSLTPREFDVLEQIVYGKSNKEIATELEISEATVKTHINSLLGKLGVTDRTQAATAALQRGIVPLESLRKAEIMNEGLEKSDLMRSFSGIAGAPSRRKGRTRSTGPSPRAAL